MQLSQDISGQTPNMPISAHPRLSGGGAQPNQHGPAWFHRQMNLRVSDPWTTFVAGAICKFHEHLHRPKGAHGQLSVSQHGFIGK